MQTQAIPQIPGLDLHSLMSFAIDPQNTQAILDVQKSMLGAPNRPQMIQWVAQSFANEVEFQKLLSERYIPDFPSNAELMKFPVESLGRYLGEHLNRNNIQLDFAGLDLSMFYGKELNAMTYFSIRGIRIHDIVHTLLGLGVSAVDEYCVASFTLAQFRSPYHMQLVSSGYINTAFYAPENIPMFLDGIHRFYNLGRKAKFITGYKFEDNFAKPLREVRRELNLMDLEEVK